MAERETSPSVHARSARRFAAFTPPRLHYAAACALALALASCAGRVDNRNDGALDPDAPRAADGALLPPIGPVYLPDGAVLLPDGALDPDAPTRTDAPPTRDVTEPFDATEPDAQAPPDAPVFVDVVRDIARADAALRDVPVTMDRDVTFREDACPPITGPAVRMYECDPLAARSTCPAGQGCYSFIDYPPMPCAREIYRSRCFPAGSTPVNGSCGSGTMCVPGSTCFVTGAGNRCLRLCRTDGSEPSCPRGQVCEPTDSPDIGACD